MKPDVRRYVGRGDVVILMCGLLGVMMLFRVPVREGTDERCESLCKQKGFES